MSRSDRKTCRECGRFLLVGDESVCERCSDDLRDPCPMGCGNQTEDVAGGPCKECWELAEAGDRYAW